MYENEKLSRDIIVAKPIQSLKRIITALVKIENDKGSTDYGTDN